MVVLILAVVVCFILPVEIAFEPPFGKSTGWEVFEWVTEAIFTVDVFFHFDTTVIDEVDGEEIYDRWHIAHHYMSEYHFWIDVASTINIKVTFFCFIIFNFIEESKSFEIAAYFKSY